MDGTDSLVEMQIILSLYNITFTVKQLRKWGKPSVID